MDAGTSERRGATGTLEDGEYVTLKNGATVVIRPLIDGDEAAIASWFAGLGSETRYARFLGQVKRLDRRVQSDLAHVDHVDHEAISAVAPDGETIGIARYIRIGHTGGAEVAVAVADDWRGQGLAGMLLARVAAKARLAGIQRFSATCLATNHVVIRLLSRLGDTRIYPSNVGIVDLRIDLTRPPSDATQEQSFQFESIGRPVGVSHQGG
jgi:RimJ/RimL family protein N-acetyltransferase